MSNAVSTTKARGIEEMAMGTVATITAVIAFTSFDVEGGKRATARAAAHYARGGRLLEGRTGRLAPRRARRRRVQERIDARGGRLHFRKGRAPARIFYDKDDGPVPFVPYMCPTCETQQGKCCECGKGVAEGVGPAPDPYAQEIDGDERQHLLCDECTQTKLDDI